MRPMNIKISAFGPYAGCVEIPMDELGTQGLYLITGDTGAGKTTIFDAICYALYGEASGGNRDASMLRSKYAAPDTPTQVELTFLHGGKQYYVRRNPEYYRPKKSGEGLTKQNADAELQMPDGHVYSKVRDVTVAIEQLLGINKDQFSQIAMLAQGDFLKLLLADTKQRQEIFRELFQTRLYQTLQYKLEDKRKEIYGQVEDGKKSINQYIHGIQVDKDDILSIDVENAQSGAMTTEDVEELLNKLTDQDSAKKDELDEELNKINNELQEVNRKIGAAKEFERAKKEVENAKTKLIEEQPKLDKINETYESAKDALKEKTKIEKEANVIETELPDYDASEKLEAEIKKLKEKNNEQVKKRNKLLKDREEKEAECNKLKTEQASFKDTSAEIEKIKGMLEKIKEEAEALVDLEDSLNNYRNSKNDLVKSQEDYKNKDEVFKRMNALYEYKEQAFRDGQAGILAEKLKAGEKCPVCGSTSHPCPAKISAEVPSEKELEKAKKESEKARAQRDKAAEDASGLRKLLETQEIELKKKTVKLINVEDLDEALEKIDDIRTACDEKRMEYKGKLVAEELMVKRKEQIDKAIPEIEGMIEKLRKSIEDISLSISSESAKAEEKGEQHTKLKNGLRFENKTEAISAHNMLIKKAEAIQKNYEKAENDLTLQKEVILKLNTAIKENEKAINSAKITDIGVQLEKQKQLVEKQRVCIAQSKTVTSRLENNENIRKNIITRAAGIEEVEKKLQWVKALSDTANGKLSGKDKVMLETYIQTTYFDRIINRANLRLVTMSSGQYELIRMQEASNGRSQSGLDLGVIDHYNGSERSVKTLSGGESFMASLSLALGLSDEVQSSSGGIQIDTMFVDEGFGSLDPDALDMAYRALAGLTEGNRLVGIISHVADLKERIEKQIVVTKEMSGGSHIKMVV